ncbi:unnamed protein product [Paramecium sonneborni]|uniref:Uncharacterized protein n=1 Tax=Paramecium sonneborni TaxID=65129 RepID=A0A8S1RS87_9CILI|nr:unnamed protein product [Paramecium sonneborni]
MIKLLSFGQRQLMDLLINNHRSSKLCLLIKFKRRINFIWIQQKWIVIQKIKADQSKYRLCFINNNLFTFQPDYGNLMQVYEMNSGDDDYIFSPQQDIKPKQLLVTKHSDNISLIRNIENDVFKIESSIQFWDYCLFVQMSDDGEYLITWNKLSKELQIWKYTEICVLANYQYMQLYNNEFYSILEITANKFNLFQLNKFDQRFRQARIQV